MKRSKVVNVESQFLVVEFLEAIVGAGCYVSTTWFEDLQASD